MRSCHTSARRGALLVAAAALTGIMAMAGAPPAHAVTCKSGYVYATGSRALTNLGARARARLKWNAKVIGLYGPIWASWALAAGKSYSCSKSGVWWRCTAKARPCRL